MKPVCLFALLCLLFSCSNSDLEYSYLKSNRQTIQQLDNINRYMISELRHNSMNNQSKYGVAYQEVLKHFDLYKSICSSDSVCAKSHKHFVDNLIKANSETFPEYHHQISNCFKDIKPTLKDSLLISALRLNCISSYQDFISNFYQGYFGGNYKFIQIYDTPISEEPNRYSFALINKDIQEHGNKNFTIDSIALNGKPIHLQNKIMPFVCSNITLDIEEPGSYEVFGHVDLFGNKFSWDYPFSHEFTISDHAD